MAKASVAHRVRAITPYPKTVCNKHHKWKNISKVKNDKEKEGTGWLICKVENSQWIKGNVWKQLVLKGSLSAKDLGLRTSKLKADSTCRKSLSWTSHAITPSQCCHGWGWPRVLWLWTEPISAALPLWGAIPQLSQAPTSLQTGPHQPRNLTQSECRGVICRSVGGCDRGTAGPQAHWCEKGVEGRAEGNKEKKE